LFQLFFVFPEEQIIFPKFYKQIIGPAVFLTSLLTFTPLVFKGVASLGQQGQVSTLAVGPGIAVFGIVVTSLIFGAIIILYKKFKRAAREQKTQIRLVLIGALVTFCLHIIFNFILPAIFSVTRFIPLGALFTFPLVAFTTYAILKHHLLSLKIVATEILTFGLTIAILLDVIVSQDPVSRLFRFSIFLLVLGVGISLIRSVRKEVQQREQLQILTRQLADANEQLKALDKGRAEFISIASHQLRTPPATVKWYLSAVLAGDYGKMDNGVKEIIGKAERTNNLLISLIEDMLNVSRIERGKMEFLFEPVDILDMAQITYEQLQPLAMEKKQTLSFTPPPGKLPEIMADKEKLRQVINNLFDNAIKYTPAGGKIRAKLEQIGDEIQFSVTDNGKGMDEEERLSVFEKYKRGKDSIKQSAGLGLGLYVAKIIIEQHKGKLLAQSPGPGKGSSFIFSLPIHSGVKKSTLVDFSQPQK
jgi:signal transduction histidine kinase